MDKYFFIVKIGRILCIEFVLRPLRVGVLLGLMAWFMQLVVFIQPLLPGGALPGLGVCQMVVDAIQDNSYKNQNHKNNEHQQHNAHSHMQHMDMDMFGMDMHDAAASMQAHDASPAGYEHAANHSLNHLSCGFCSLFGHAMPASLTSPQWVEVSQRPFVTLPPFADQSIDVLNISYLHPKSRAPPLSA